MLRGSPPLAVCLAGIATLVVAACGLPQTPLGVATTAAPAGTGASPAGVAAGSATPIPPAVQPSQPIPQPPAPLAHGWPAHLPAYVSQGTTARKRIALTFDADMYPWMYAERAAIPEFDPRIIRLLESTHTPATIFLNGLWAKAYPATVKALARDPGVELANHSWDHAGWTPRCANTTPIEAPMTPRTEVTDVAELVRTLTGSTVRYFRYPGGCHSTASLALVRSLGEEPIGWNCFFGDTYDWSTAAQVASVEHGCRPGSIVITHINGPPFHPNVYEALERLIPWWRQHGWTVVTVSTLLGLPPASTTLP